jgi:hypothetical protein
MMTPTTASWTAPAGSAAVVRATFASLDRGTQRLVEALLFDGDSCARIAAVLGAPAIDVRARAGEAMLALQRALAPRGIEHGAVAAMFMLRALDALDADENELIDTMLLHRPELQRSYDACCELIGELCTMVPRVTPVAGVLARISSEIAAVAIDDFDDVTAN